MSRLVDGSLIRGSALEAILFLAVASCPVAMIFITTVSSAIYLLAFNSCMVVVLAVSNLSFRSHSRKSLARSVFAVLSVLFLIGLIITPAHSALFVEYPLAGDPRPRGITVYGGGVWFTEQIGNKIGFLSGTNVYEWNCPTPGSEPWDIVGDSRGYKWFTESHDAHVVAFRDGVYRVFVTSGTSAPYNRGITVDQNKTQNVWFAEYSENKIAKVRPSATRSVWDPVALQWKTEETWILMEYGVPTSNSGPNDVAVDSNGFVWFTEEKVGKIGRLNPWSGKVTEYTVSDLGGIDIFGSPYMDRLRSLAIDSKGYVWFTLDLDLLRAASGGSPYDKLGKLNPWTGEYVLYDIPTQHSGPCDVAILDNSVWFTEYDKSIIGRYLMIDNAFHEYACPTTGSYPCGIAVSGGGNVWYTEWSGNKIAFLDPSALVTMSGATTLSTATSAISTGATSSYGTANPTVSADAYFTRETLISTASSNVEYATSALSTVTNTRWVLPTTTWTTTTSVIASTTSTSTTTSATLTTVVSTYCTTTTTTASVVSTSYVSTTSTTTTISQTSTEYVSSTTSTKYLSTTTTTRTTTGTSTSVITSTVPTTGITTSTVIIPSTTTTTTVTTVTVTVTTAMLIPIGIFTIGIIISILLPKARGWLPSFQAWLRHAWRFRR